ncbi:MAG: hypothetical protein JJU27_01890 [Gammaproteobacteria bacterium]|nr:hypothetical protein [Gammaproteobacteria bacterium]
MSGEQDKDFSAASFEGAARAQLRDTLLRSTPEERVRWLSEMLDVAEASGALARIRAAEDAYWQRLWNATPRR